MKLPFMVVSDGCGNIFEIPKITMAGMALTLPVLPNHEDLIPLPHGSDLFTLPGRVAMGYDPGAHDFVEIPTYNGDTVYPVAAFMAPAHLQLYRSAYRRLHDAPVLSLYSYTSVGWQNGTFYVTGTRIDPDTRQDLKFMNADTIQRKAVTVRKRYSNNRLARHLIDNCVFRYGCPAARNFVMGRWECPLPTSPYCNSGCIGCISKQPRDTTIMASQERIEFIPTVEEIVEIAVPHLQNAPYPVVSFGQGCEGEPLLIGDVIEESIREIRRRTERGVININTNASRPEVVERLCKAGLDSIRVSLNSAQEHYYTAYYRPQGYNYEHVVASIKISVLFHLWTSLNYFMFPGFTDHPAEISALERLISTIKLNMIQTRNLNIDPELYIEELHLLDLSPEFMGIKNWIRHIKKKFPWVKLGYFNPPREKMKEKHFGFSR